MFTLPGRHCLGCSGANVRSSSFQDIILLRYQRLFDSAHVRSNSKRRSGLVSAAILVPALEVAGSPPPDVTISMCMKYGLEVEAAFVTAVKETIEQSSTCYYEISTCKLNETSAAFEYLGGFTARVFSPNECECVIRSRSVTVVCSEHSLNYFNFTRSLCVFAASRIVLT